MILILCIIGAILPCLYSGYYFGIIAASGLSTLFGFIVTLIDYLLSKLFKYKRTLSSQFYKGIIIACCFLIFGIVIFKPSTNQLFKQNILSKIPENVTNLHGIQEYIHGRYSVIRISFSCDLKTINQIIAEKKLTLNDNLCDINKQLKINKKYSWWTPELIKNPKWYRRVSPELDYEENIWLDEEKLIVYYLHA